MQSPLQFYTVEEARKLLGVGRTLFYRLVRAGHLRAIKLGRATRIAGPDIAAFQNSLPDVSARAIRDRGT